MQSWRIPPCQAVTTIHRLINEARGHSNEKHLEGMGIWHLWASGQAYIVISFRALGINKLHSISGACRDTAG